MFPDVPCCGGRLGVLTKLCPVLIGATSGSLLSLASGSPADLQVLLAGGMLVLSYDSPLGFNYRSHLGRLGVKPVVYLRGFLPEDSQCCAMHGVTQCPTSL